MRAKQNMHVHPQEIVNWLTENKVQMRGLADMIGADASAISKLCRGDVPGLPWDAMARLQIVLSEPAPNDIKEQFPSVYHSPGSRKHKRHPHRAANIAKFLDDAPDVTVSDLAELIGVKPKTVRRWIANQSTSNINSVTYDKFLEVKKAWRVTPTKQQPVRRKPQTTKKPRRRLSYSTRQRIIGAGYALVVVLVLLAVVGLLAFTR